MELNEINAIIEDSLPNNSEIGIIINKDEKGNIRCDYYIQPLMQHNGAQKTDSLYWALKEIVGRLKK